MEATTSRFAHRCLPLLMANQAGWFVLNGHDVEVTWDGTNGVSGIRFEWLAGPEPFPAVSHFGYGILTWLVPYLFRTPPGYNLLVRGPANYPKDGACPLEGLVETDWSVAGFTMNWKLTRPGLPVRCAREEPICMIVPQRRGELEEFRPEIRGIDADPVTSESFKYWQSRRNQFLNDLKVPESEAVKQEWQKHYFQGTSPDGRRAPEHQTKLHLSSFE
jgi:hypothetical protein